MARPINADSDSQTANYKNLGQIEARYVCVRCDKAQPTERFSVLLSGYLFLDWIDARARAGKPPLNLVVSR